MAANIEALAEVPARSIADPVDQGLSDNRRINEIDAQLSLVRKTTQRGAASELPSAMYAYKRIVRDSGDPEVHRKYVELLVRLVGAEAASSEVKTLPPMINFSIVNAPSGVTVKATAESASGADPIDVEMLVPTGDPGAGEPATLEDAAMPADAPDPEPAPMNVTDVLMDLGLTKNDLDGGWPRPHIAPVAAPAHKGRNS